MRDTHKLLTTALTTAVLILLAAAATAAGASLNRGSGHHRDGRSHSRGCLRRARSCKAASTLNRSHHRTHAKKPKAAKTPKTPTAAPSSTQPEAPRDQLHGRRRTREVQEVEEGEGGAVDQAAIAAALATPCENTEVTPTGENTPLVRAAVLCLINRERAEHGIAPLRLDANLEAAAENHCAEMIGDDYFAHVAPDGETPVQRIEHTGYIPGPSVGYVIGENLAWGTYQLSTPQSIVAAWIASPGHLANILESRYTETGIGITPSVPQSLGEGNPGATYAQEFGVIIH